MPSTPGRLAKGHDDFYGEPPVIWKWDNVQEGDQHGLVRWLVRPPCGHQFMLAHPPGQQHEVDEHEDGTVSVQPKPNNSNSILCPSCGWHGYIDHNTWTNA